MEDPHLGCLSCGCSVSSITNSSCVDDTVRPDTPGSEWAITVTSRSGEAMAARTAVPPILGRNWRIASGTASGGDLKEVPRGEPFTLPVDEIRFPHDEVSDQSRSGRQAQSLQMSSLADSLTLGAAEAPDNMVNMKPMAGVNMWYINLHVVGLLMQHHLDRHGRVDPLTTDSLVLDLVAYGSWLWVPQARRRLAFKTYSDILWCLRCRPMAAWLQGIASAFAQQYALVDWSSGDVLSGSSERCLTSWTTDLGLQRRPQRSYLIALGRCPKARIR